MKLAEVLKLDKEELLVQFISDRIAYEIADEDCASKVLKVAEQKVKYLKSNLAKTKLWKLIHLITILFLIKI